MSHSKSRRNALKNIALTTGGVSLGISALSCKETSEEQEQVAAEEEQALKGNINHSACYWC
ncbi:MAG TPA: hydroxypyruvate isomerase, partial [Leeuwenhoekiella sp.]|nr:hydroxypyruvate isomerase [Leeuwenhoekiella sp.]